MTRAVICIAVWMLTGCGSMDSETVKEVAGEVLTLKSGTVSELRRNRGRGVMHEYDLPPEELLTVVYRAAKKAKGVDGKPIRGLWKRKVSLEVVAKERTLEFVESEEYSDPWRSAMLAMIHPVPGDPTRSRVEIHWANKGPFHKGRIDWARQMPEWIDEVIGSQCR